MLHPYVVFAFACLVSGTTLFSVNHAIEAPEITVLSPNVSEIAEDLFRIIDGERPGLSVLLFAGSDKETLVVIYGHRDTLLVRTRPSTPRELAEEFRRQMDASNTLFRGGYMDDTVYAINGKTYPAYAEFLVYTERRA
jgi:hypothetical protein